MIEKRNTFKKTLFAKVFIILVVLVGLSVNVYLAISTTLKTTTKAAETVEIFFSPETAGIPPDTVFKFMLDPNSQEISFLRTTINFDRDILQLSSSPILGNSSLFTYQQLTPLEEANQTGRVEIILMQRPQSTAPADTFEVFSLPVTFLSTSPSVTSYITVTDEDTQIVGSNAIELPFTVNYATVEVKGGSVGSRLVDRITSNQQGECASSDFIDTAIGCIPINDNQKLAEFWLRFGLGIAGGIALILIVYAGYIITTSQGDPHRLQSGKELLTAALMGLLLLAFAAFILRVIGVDILQLPGF